MKKIYFLLATITTVLHTNAQWQKVTIDGFPIGIGINRLYNDGSTFWAGTVGQIYKSTDNGTTWSNASNGLQSGISGVSGFAKLGNRMYASFSGNGNYFTYYTTDNGANWIIDTAGWVGIAGILPAPIQLHTHNDYILARLESNYIMYKKNTDSIWSVLPVPNAFRTPGAMYSVGDTLVLGIGNVALTVDMGQNWTTRNYAPSPMLSIGYFSSFSQNMDQPKTLYANYTPFSTNKPILVKSMDNGVTWDSLSIQLDAPASISSLWAKGNQLYVAFNGTFTAGDTLKKVFHSTDGGQTWNNLTGDLYTMAQFKFHSVTGLVPINGQLFAAGLSIPNAAMAKLSLGSTGLDSKTSSSVPTFFYPNPASNVLTLDPSVEQCSILDLSGKIVLTKESSNQIDLTNLPSGMYIVKTMVNQQLRYHKLYKN